MPLEPINEQKLDAYDVILGGDKSYDPAMTPVFNGLDHGPDSPQWSKMQYVFDAPTVPNAAGSAEGGQWSQGALSTFGDPSRLYLRGHYQKYLVGAGEITNGDQGYAMQGLTTEQYQIKRTMTQLIRDGELICIGAQENQAGNTLLPYNTRGLELYILPTSLIALQTDADTVIDAAFRPSAGQVKEVTTGTGDFTFDESDLITMVNAAYDVRKIGVKWKGWCTTRLKSKISAWGNLTPTVSSYTVVRRFNQDADEKKMVTSIQTWVGDAGEVELALHGDLRRNTATQKAEGIFLEDGYTMKRVRMKPLTRKMEDDAGVKRSYGMMAFGVQSIPIFCGQVRRAAA